MSELSALIRLREEAQSLPAELQAHTGRVVVEARRLAQHYELDSARVEAAAWGHDLFRGYGSQELFTAASELRIKVDPVTYVCPILLHGPIAAKKAQQSWGINDAEILEAIRWHTTANSDMSLFAMAVFLADKIEPVKVRLNTELIGIRKLAPHDPEGAILTYLEWQFEHHLRNGHPIHPASVEARNVLRFPVAQT